MPAVLDLQKGCNSFMDERAEVARKFLSELKNTVPDSDIEIKRKIEDIEKWLWYTNRGKGMIQ